jgi:maltooligosyltrehalose trehalohydrolase
MKRFHEMPFGAEWKDGSTRFRIWAPSADQVELSLITVNVAARLPLEAVGEGWFELRTDIAKPGDRYKFRINGSQEVPDPASRFQPEDVHGPSEIRDPAGFEWTDGGWKGRQWEQAVLYELHVGTFSDQGTFSGVTERLDYLADLGITALELMPLADFPGERNWGYDGVYLFSPDSRYGSCDDLKELVQGAHHRGMMVLLDVVYNHFGPEGNYLHGYAPQFFSDRHSTPWGNAINFDGPQSRPVRDFLIHNALYWLHEYHFDGLRLDAVHAIVDDSSPEFLTELAHTVRHSVAEGRHVHLILENDKNQADYLGPVSGSRPLRYSAQWNDDFHHCMHVLLTGESDGYYSDYSDHPLLRLGRCLTEGFAYQGETSRHREGHFRGEPTSGLTSTAFVCFLQNHDQIGNRAFGERISELTTPDALRVATAIFLLSPFPPLLFMGEEFAAETPFLFFCDFESSLASRVTEGRRNEFAHFSQFRDQAARERIPDPSARETFEDSKLNWASVNLPRHAEWLRFYRDLLKLRSTHIIPHLDNTSPLSATFETYGERGLAARWILPDGLRLSLLANLGCKESSGIPIPAVLPIYASAQLIAASKQQTLPGWFAAYFLES